MPPAPTSTITTGVDVTGSTCLPNTTPHETNSPSTSSKSATTTTTIGLYFIYLVIKCSNIFACCVALSNKKLSPISGSGILDIDISDALCKRDLQNLKHLIFNAKKKHCHFSKQISDLARRVISCEILSQTEIDLLKYELDLALENVNETDPEIECLIQRTFTNFEEEEHDTGAEENPDDLQAQSVPVSQNPDSDSSVAKPVVKFKATNKPN